MKQVWITKVGPPEVLKIKEAPDPEVQAGQVRIRVRASGINFADIMARLGLYPDAPKLPAVVGYEISGVVDQVGDGVSQFKTGDRVLGTCRFGGYSDTVVIPTDQVFALPERFSFEEGATLPVNYLTAYQMLFGMGAVKENDWVVVHSAGGGVGFAAIDLCHIAGAKIIGIASTPKHETLRSRGVEHLIDSRTTDFEHQVLDITQGKGAQWVLDPVGGQSWAKGFRCLSPTGRLVVFGFSALATNHKKSLLQTAKQLWQVPWLRFNPVTLMNENKGVLGVNLGHMWERQDLIQVWVKQLLSWAESGKLHPTVDKTFPLAQAADAHQYIESRLNKGKVVLTA